MSVRVAVTGATGRMGREVIAAAEGRGDLEVVAALNRDPDATDVLGVEVRPAASFADVLGDREPNVLVDFTGPASTAEYARSAAEAGVAVVTGTTGLTAEHEAELDRAADAVPVLHAPNFSRGIAALEAAVRSVAADLPGYDVEVVETHHAGKRDAPSGTARELVGAVESARDGGMGRADGPGSADASEDRGTGDGIERVHGRSGHAPRAEGEVGVHAVRAGDVTGEHVVVLAGNDEQVRLEHRAGDRRAFAAGALDAAAWVAGRDAGRYDLSEVGR